MLAFSFSPHAHLESDKNERACKPVLIYSYVLVAGPDNVNSICLLIKATDKVQVDCLPLLCEGTRCAYTINGNPDQHTLRFKISCYVPCREPFHHDHYSSCYPDPRES